jgi:hypothetical protein
MLDSLLKTIARISNQVDDAPIASPTQSELIERATGCMLEGLPDSFEEAWIRFHRLSPDTNEIEYMFVSHAGDQPQPFQPADELFPVQCVHQLDQFLVEDERNWKSCRLSFSPTKARLSYESSI